MKFFIPAWYSSRHWWESKAEPFYYKHKETAFDDIISLMSMHRQNKQPYALIVLNYTPDLRTFLHRYDLFDTSYWSVFDHIQGFKHKTPTALDYRQLDWPTGTEFLYLQNMVRALMPDERYANIHFSEEGYVVWIEIFHQEIQCYRYIFDDRGYFSSIVYFNEAGQAERQQYMMYTGDWILEEDLIEQTVIVNPQYQDAFSASTYATMEAIIFEYLAHYEETMMSQEDCLIVAADHRHNTRISETFTQQSLCLSVFHQREQLSMSHVASMADDVKWLVDTIENERLLTTYHSLEGISQRLMRITPFDAQTLPNISSQLHETYIGVWLDGLEDKIVTAVLAQLADYLTQDDTLRVVLLTEKRAHQLDRKIKQQVESINVQMNEALGKTEMMTDLMEAPPPIKYITIKHVPFELDIIEAVTTLRIIVDLSLEPDLFLQICCLSAGLPQINACATEYVTHGFNGYILNEGDNLAPALDYYLTQLKNWNQSYAFAMTQAKKYSSNSIIAQLDTLIEGERDGQKV
ncbi:accessory Sec system protein Asp1 [Staphylococcus americanisciuri]|uniref:Accessory Sec system protein Asp1 n=1 Tax=Staphylococcus americanisciuri TaxID=2973940 RepID=A0ABT2F4M0_9STAP|nr:accessory Sec system protein Asp1 [Staphylococcus americanisciuri]MCS4487342.1 accessory Sec system protein Asp1 [Staphylococcus americanisciuri]